MLPHFGSIMVTSCGVVIHLLGNDWSHHVRGYDETALPAPKAINPSPISVLTIYFKEDEMTNIEKATPESLDFLSQGKAMIEKASTVDEVRQIRDKAEALRILTKKSRMSLEVQNECAEVRIRAERRAGEMLKEMAKTNQREGRGGDRKSNSDDGRLNLGELGINYNESSRYQKIAELPKNFFESQIKNTKKSKKELTTAQFLTLSRRIAKEKQESDAASDFGALLRNAVRKADALILKIGDILERKDALRWADIWGSDERRDLCRVFGLLVGIGQDLLDELEAIEESKAKEPKKTDVTEMASEATVS